MKKKLIALAIAGAISAPVMADGDHVTLYGVVDMLLKYQGGAKVYNEATDSYDSPGSGFKKSRLGVDSGVLNGSRFGIKGEKKISDGMSGVFQVESKVNGDTSGGDIGFRQAWAGFKFGGSQVSLGRQYAPYFGWGSQAGVNTFDSGVLTDYSVYRVDNSIAYKGKFGPVSLGVMYSQNREGDESSTSGEYSRRTIVEEALGIPGTVTPNWDTTHVSLAAQYASGPIKVGLGVISESPKVTDTAAGFTGEASTEKVNSVQLGFSYAIGSITPWLALESTKAKPTTYVIAADGTRTSTSGDTTTKTGLGLGVDVALGADTLAFSLGTGKMKTGDSDVNPKGTQVGLAYVHAMNKAGSSNLYAGVGLTSNKKGGTYGFGNADGGSTYSNIVAVGFQHWF